MNRPIFLTAADDTISIHGAVAPGDDVLVFLKGNEIIRKVPLVSSAAPG